MEDEAVDVSRLGIELLVTSVFIALTVSLMFYGKRWFAKEEYYKYQTAYMKESAENWTLESRATNAEYTFLNSAAKTTNEKLADIPADMKISGDDIINFIVRNDARYQYYIRTKTRDTKIEREDADARKYTESYLLDTAGLGIRASTTQQDGLSSKYYVKIIKKNDDIEGYIFTWDGQALTKNGILTDKYTGNIPDGTLTTIYNSYFSF